LRKQAPGRERVLIHAFTKTKNILKVFAIYYHTPRNQSGNYSSFLHCRARIEVSGRISTHFTPPALPCASRGNKQITVERKRVFRGGANAHQRIGRIGQIRPIHPIRPVKNIRHIRPIRPIISDKTILSQKNSAMRTSRQQTTVERKRAYRGGAAAPSNAWTQPRPFKAHCNILATSFNLVSSSPSAVRASRQQTTVERKRAYRGGAAAPSNAWTQPRP